MFRCGKCGQNSKPGTKAKMLVVSDRDHSHPERHYVAKGKEIHDPGGAGTQIVREIQICESCP